ncbi:MAG TPA: mannose/fructose/sorbose family PTS transporter subunit IIC [Erysipelothrix sp.]|nr:mannose/fructose/sorbose family PTS transporter subunit IIC [Erysipelothrix sp.]
MNHILIFIIGAIAGVGSVLDEFQTHRAIIVSPMVGAVLGDLPTGIVIGGTLEMLSLGWMNIGAAMAPDAALAGIISTILVVGGGQDINAGIAIAIPVAAAGSVLTILVRTATVPVQHAADKSIEDGNLKRVDYLTYLALSFQALRVAIPSVLVSVSVGTDAVQNFLNSIPEVITGGLAVGGGMIVVVGYAMVINMIKTADLLPFLFLGFTVALIPGLGLVALGVIGLVLALLYVQLTPSLNQTAAVNGNVESAEDEF